MSLSKHILVKAFSTLRATSSLGIALSHLLATFSLGKGFFAFQSYVLAPGTRFRSVIAFSSLLASFSLGKKRFRLSEARFR